MAENQENNQEQEYDKLATDEPVRDVELPSDSPTGGQSFSDRAAYYGDLTDMQAILMRLFPENREGGEG